MTIALGGGDQSSEIAAWHHCSLRMQSLTMIFDVEISNITLNNLFYLFVGEKEVSIWLKYRPPIMASALGISLLKLSSKRSALT